MIVPMKKVSLIIPDDKKAQTLRTLRALGLMHIDIAEGTGAPLAALNDRMALLESAVFTVGEKPKKKIPVLAATPAEALAIAEEIAALTEEKKACDSRKAAWIAELERLKDWGEVDPAALQALADKGLSVTLYDLPREVYGALGDEVKTVVFRKTKAAVKCLVMPAGAAVDEQTEQALRGYRVALPSVSTAAMRQEIAALDERMCAIAATLATYAGYVGSMKAAMAALEKDIEFETYAGGMAGEMLSADKTVGVAYFTGYVEAENLDRLKAVAKENAWGLTAEEPTVEDDVPTKLKNNKFVSLIYPLTDFLGTVPGYFEHDISAWFLMFILIFFGIIFGDGGYGLLICAIAALPIGKAVVTQKPVSPTYLLVGLFGLSTVVWGTLTCTWFGLTPAQLPDWLKSLSVPFISNVYADTVWYPFWTEGQAGLTTAQNLQIVCFTLALVQLTVAHVIGAVHNRKSLKLLGDVGMIFQLIGIYYVVLSLVVNGAVFPLSLVIGGVPVGTVAIALVGVGFVLSFVFANYEGSVLKAIAASMTNIVSVLLGVVNVFSDIVSYIRLWAVGLAGAAISATVNELAGPLFGNFLFMVLAIVLLIFGHGLNMILNILSVIVHGIRLNTLEFSSHLDMSWSGHKFKPFKE